MSNTTTSRSNLFPWQSIKSNTFCINFILSIFNLFIDIKDRQFLGEFEAELDKKMSASDEESSVRLPVIIHVDPIWPPHMRKKRQPESFQDLLKRKKGLLMFLGKNPVKEDSPSDFRNEDTLLTVMERVKRREEHQRRILKKIQHRALQNLKTDFEELENSDTFGADENHCHFPTQRNLHQFDQRLKMRRKNKNAMESKMVSERSVPEKLERTDKDALHLHKRSKLRIGDDESDPEIKVPRGREDHLEYKKTLTHENKVLSSPHPRKEKVMPHRRTPNGFNQNQQQIKYMNFRGGNGGQENNKMKKQSKMSGKGKNNYLTPKEILPQGPIEVSEIEIQANEKTLKPMKNK